MKFSNILSFFTLGAAFVSAIPVAEPSTSLSTRQVSIEDLLSEFLDLIAAVQATATGVTGVVPAVVPRQTTIEGLLAEFLDVVKDGDSPAVTDLAAQLIAAIQAIAGGATTALPGLVPRQTSIEDLAAQLLAVIKDGDSPAVTDLLSQFIAAVEAVAGGATVVIPAVVPRQVEVVTGLVTSLVNVLTGLLGGLLGGLAKRQVDTAAVNLDAVLATINAILAILGLPAVSL